MKETKDLTKVAVLGGDSTAMPRDQPMDTGLVAQMPEGVSLTTVDMGMDTSTFTDAGDHALESVGANYGLSMAALKHQLDKILLRRGREHIQERAHQSHHSEHEGRQAGAEDDETDQPDQHPGLSGKQGRAGHEQQRSADDQEQPPLDPHPRIEPLQQPHGSPS